MQAADVFHAERAAAAELTVIVMDPLAAPLSCPCVEGYAQRKYEVLAEYLQRKTGRTVRLEFVEALETALKEKTQGRADLVIGKDSVVRWDAKSQGIKVTPIARLTGKDGSTTQNGLFVVSRDDPAKSVKDLKGYRILFGPVECDEKHKAALAALSEAQVPAPQQLEIDQACSDGACKVVELGPAGRAAAVISSYAAPLLEGCGTIQKGDLRVVGRTKPVPFITAFATSSVDSTLRQQLQSLLLDAASDPKLLEALESLVGFVPVDAAPQSASAATKSGF